MAGKLNTDSQGSGTEANSTGFNVKEAKAYCEGRKANVAVAAVTTNPFAAGTRLNQVWRQGYNSAALLTTGAIDHCSEPVPGFVATPNLIGMDGSTANAEITRLAFVVGTVTGASGVVTVQNPVADVRTAKGASIDYTRA